MDLSVIIPCHNLEDCITSMLDSLNMQNLHSFKVEIIFVFDACSDNTRNVVENYLPFTPKYEAIHLINADVKSCGFARNVGLDYATGNYIWFMDGDDWLLDNDAIALCIYNMNNTEYPVLKFGFDYPDTFKFGDSPVMVWQYCYKKSIIGDTRFLSIQPHEDVAFNNEIFAKVPNQTILVLNKNLYYYNYGRIGSNMQQLLTTGEIKP